MQRVHDHKEGTHRGVDAAGLHGTIAGGLEISTQDYTLEATDTAGSSAGASPMPRAPACSRCCSMTPLKSSKPPPRVALMVC